jgi:hypothetical protein
MIRNLFTDPPWITGEGIICNDRNILLGNLISGHETIVKPFLFSHDTPATYGDTGPLRGPGNRAIGHGALAERVLEPMLPDD